MLRMEIVKQCLLTYLIKKARQPLCCRQFHALVIHEAINKNGITWNYLMKSSYFQHKKHIAIPGYSDIALESWVDSV